MKNLKNRIEEYIQNKSQHPDLWLGHCADQKKLSDAIVFSAMAENHLGKRHPHQYRRRKSTLESFSLLLLDQIERIRMTNSFHDLLTIVAECKVKDIGALTFYDTATRIGAYLKIYPEKVYLHTGTKQGAEKLLGKRLRSGVLERNELPEVFQDSRLSCADLEDILCHLRRSPLGIVGKELEKGQIKRRIC
jgi:hypothetical protein